MPLNRSKKWLLLATLIPIAITSPRLPDIPSDSEDTASHTHSHLMHTAGALCKPKEKPRPKIGGHRITEEYLQSLSEAECIWRFRFTLDELRNLSQVMELPGPLITKCGFRSLPLESLSLLCARLRSPEDLWSLATKYARPQSAISEIVNETASFINTRWGGLLAWDHAGILSQKNLNVYAAALHDFGAPTSTIIGFIDCTIQRTCRPVDNQELAYTGYKKFHGMKFQAVVTPNGLIAHLAGPYRAPQNDNGVLRESGLVGLMERYAIQEHSQEGDPAERRFYQVYGDSAYGVSPWVLSPYAHVGELTNDERAWNSAMGGVRISVEHGFGLVTQDWPYLQCFWKHKILGNPCGLLYRVAVLLTNAHACVMPNQTAQRYSCPPPSLEEYFHA